MSRYTLCVQWPRFGPYHLARLEELARHCLDEDIRMVALETAVVDELYDWKVEASTSAFERVQVFRDRAFEQISPFEMHRSVRRELDRIDPDVVAIHTYSFPDSRACLEWCADHRRGSILMTDTKADDAPRIAWREWIKRKLVNSFDSALLAGTPQKKYYESLGFPSRLIHLGYDVVDNQYFAEKSDEVSQYPEQYQHLPGLSESTPFFLAVNRFITVKNLDVLLRAYRSYRKRSDDPWRLVMVGDGPLGAELEGLVDSLSIEGVTFAGFRQIDELPAYYGLASCFIHPAIKDTWALVVNEAMAAGLPILVSTGAGCYVDLVDEGNNGYSFSPNDEERLSELMVSVSASPEFRQSASTASRRIVDDWNLERFAKSMLMAAEAARTRSGRGLPWLVRVLITMLKRTDSVTAFHSAEI